MSVSLPTNPAPNGATPLLLDFGGELTPFLGGPVTRLNRIGSRLSIRVTMPPLRGAVARQFQVRLLRGKSEGAILPWPLLDLDPGSPPDPRISATSNGSALSINGLGSGYQFVEGQPISVIHGGRRYVHLITGAVTAPTGSANVGVFPPTRTAYSVGSVVEISAPKIEGSVSPGDELSWEMAVTHTMGFSFSIVESR